MNFDGLRRKKLRDRSGEDRSGGGLFDKDWEVFVARYDRDTGRYESSTYCCEDVISSNYVG